jgi:hypothetical protein
MQSLHLRNESGEQEKTFQIKGTGPSAVDAGATHFVFARPQPLRTQEDSDSSCTNNK